MNAIEGFWRIVSDLWMAFSLVILEDEGMYTHAVRCNKEEYNAISCINQQASDKLEPAGLFFWNRETPGAK